MTDDQLKNVVHGKYVCSTKRIGVIEDALKKTTLTVTDREVLFMYLESRSHRASMAEMKRVVLERIGYKTKNNWGTTVSRDELEAIYKHIIGDTPNGENQTSKSN